MQFCPSYHLVGASPLPLDAGYLLKVTPVLHSCHSSAYSLAGASLSLDVGYLLMIASAPEAQGAISKSGPGVDLDPKTKSAGLEFVCDC